MKRITKIFIYVPLISLALFNLLFITLSLKGPEAFYWQFRQIIQKDFLGMTWIIFFIILVILFLYNFVLKKNLLRFLQLGFFVLLLYFIAFNLVLFPSLNRINHRSLDTFFTLKKDVSLDEALQESYGRYARHIENYLKLNKTLEHKTLIIPPSSALKSDYFFHVLIKPKSIIIKDYDFQLTEEVFKELNKLKVMSYPAFVELRKIREYRKIDASKESNVYYLFTSGMIMIFVPEDIAVQQILITHD